MKEKLEQDPAERQFNFSEVYIFGKFESFHRRLVKIIDVFNTMKTYSVLQESKIEGLEGMITKYEVHSNFGYPFSLTWKWNIKWLGKLENIYQEKK